MLYLTLQESTGLHFAWTIIKFLAPEQSDCYAIIWSFMKSIGKIKDRKNFQFPGNPIYNDNSVLKDYVILPHWTSSFMNTFGKILIQWNLSNSDMQEKKAVLMGHTWPHLRTYTMAQSIHMYTTHLDRKLIVHRWLDWTDVLFLEQSEILANQ